MFSPEKVEESSGQLWPLKSEGESCTEESHREPERESPKFVQNLHSHLCNPSSMHARGRTWAAQEQRSELRFEMLPKRKNLQLQSNKSNCLLRKASIHTKQNLEFPHVIVPMLGIRPKIVSFMKTGKICPLIKKKENQQTNLEITQMFKWAFKDFEAAVVIILLYYNSTQALPENRREGNTSQLILWS